MSGVLDYLKQSNCLEESQTPEKDHGKDNLTIKAGC